MTTPSPLSHRTVSRRWILAGIPATGLVLTGCGSSDGSAGTSSPSSAAATASTAASATATTTVTADGAAATGSVAALAQAFHQTLDADQRSDVLLDYGLGNAARWSNLPQSLLTGGGAGGGPGGGGGGQSRVGISIGDLDDDQLAAFTALMKAATGTAAGLGYDEITQQLDADDYLAAHGGGDAYGRDQFYVALLGSPQDTGTWELQFGGHHLAVANTYTDGVLVGATPSFRGVEPNGDFQQGGQTNHPMAVKEAALTAMLAALSTDELTSAKLSDVFTDLVLKPGNDWAFPTDHEGVRVSTLTAGQQALVLAAIASYVDDVADADAQRILATYQGELADTYVAYSGTTALTEENDYVRIDGPSVWIEFSMQHGIVLSGNHPHSVWRDRVTDYGGTTS